MSSSLDPFTRNLLGAMSTIFATAAPVDFQILHKKVRFHNCVLRIDVSPDLCRGDVLYRIVVSFSNDIWAVRFYRTKDTTVPPVCFALRAALGESLDFPEPH